MKTLIKKIIPSFFLDWYHLSLSFLGRIIYRDPSRSLTVIGVTGTSGKSTVVGMTREILRKKGKTASISSVEARIGDRSEKNSLKMTMPGGFKIHRFLRKALNRGCKFVVLEVTSEGIIQYRHKFIDFENAVFTNLYLEHIERHGGLENYRRAKLKLFSYCKNTHIINLDDSHADYFLAPLAEKKIGFSTSDAKSEKTSEVIKGEEIEEDLEGIKFKVRGAPFSLNFWGKFNVYNALAAISVGLSQNISLATCKEALEEMKGVSGRMELVIKSPFRVIVDYAHTPASLEKVYENLSKFKDFGSNMICALGACGGGRDKWKRPEMGKIAEKYCDCIILTNEDPYDEDPEKILDDIEEGIKKGGIERILNRRSAIRRAVSAAKEGDTVVITGKGSEPWMQVKGGKKIPWDDREIVREAFKGEKNF